VQYAQQWGRDYPIEFDIMATSITADARPVYVRRWEEARAAAAPGKLGPFMDLVNAFGVRDMVDPVFCLNDEHRFALNLQRLGPKRRPFIDREINLLHLAATELHWLHTTGRLQLSALTRPAAPPPLSPRLKEFLEAMLAGQGIKQIAYSLGISIHTAREHVQRLYRHFNVCGRDELMAKFIRPGPPPA
jgi:DNA-binding CsgD family transcriptional regulator